MPKVSTHQFFVGKIPKVFDVHYRSKGSVFYVKLPEEMYSDTGLSSDAPTEKEATQKAQDIIREWEKSKATRRKVLLVYIPDDEPMSSHHLNGFRLEYVSMTFGIKITQEVTIKGEKYYVNDRGERDYIGRDDFVAIEWTDEREKFLLQAVETLQQSKARIREFCKRAQAKPELMLSMAKMLEWKGAPSK